MYWIARDGWKKNTKKSVLCYDTEPRDMVAGRREYYPSIGNVQYIHLSDVTVRNPFLHPAIKDTQTPYGVVHPVGIAIPTVVRNVGRLERAFWSRSPDTQRYKIKYLSEKEDKIVRQRFKDIIDLTGNPPISIKSFNVGAQGEKSMSAFQLPDGRLYVLKMGARKDIERELEGYYSMKQFPIGKYMPSIRYSHHDHPVQENAADNLPEDMGYYISDMIYSYQNRRQMLIDGELSEEQARLFLKEYALLNQDMWDAYPPIYNALPDLQDTDFYSMQHLEWPALKNQNRKSFQTVAHLLLRGQVTPERIDRLRKASLRVRLRRNDGTLSSWQTLASYQAIEDYLDEANQAPIACLVNGNNDTSWKNLLDDGMNIWNVDTEMYRRKIPLGRTIAVMGKGRSPTLADKKQNYLQGVLYDEKNNIINVLDMNIAYSPAALAVEDEAMHTIIPAMAERYNVNPKKLLVEYQQARVNSEFYASAYLSGDEMRANPFAALLYWYEAAQWMKQAKETVRGSKTRRS